MPLPGIPPWIDQDLVLYHGTLATHIGSIMQGVDVTKGKHLRDFGRGFYTSTSKVHAEHWANNLALDSTDPAAVIEFTVSRNDHAQLDCLFFMRGDPGAADFWSFVQYCRTIAADHNRAQTQWYDIVSGPVAGDWKKQSVIRNADQVSFHTAAGAMLLDGSAKVQVV
ncbi:MAG: DUF3990 domain-containing protein [Gemmataceae bacterium]|nr:DUF3990 domain-containing protein [Gemmataceae bacterium]